MAPACAHRASRPGLIMRGALLRMLVQERSAHAGAIVPAAASALDYRGECAAPLTLMGIVLVLSVLAVLFFLYVIA